MSPTRYRVRCCHCGQAMGEYVATANPTPSVLRTGRGEIYANLCSRRCADGLFDRKRK